MSLKGRVKFCVGGMHPLLNLVRDHFIEKGFAMIPWEDEEKPDFCLIGADLEGSDYMPLAQLELQRMNVQDRDVVLLSSQDLVAPFDWDAAAPDVVAGVLYARCAEHVFTCRDQGNTLVLRPCGVFGPDVSSFINLAIDRAKTKSPLWNPANSTLQGHFIWQEDFLDAIDFLMDKGIKRGTYDVTSHESMLYVNVLRNIWKFVNDNYTEPQIYYSDNPYFERLPNVPKLEELGWKPKLSIRSGLFRMVQL